jgi:hypothetical protein
MHSAALPQIKEGCLINLPEDGSLPRFGPTRKPGDRVLAR